MTRVSRGVTVRRKHKRVLQSAAGFRGRRSVSIRAAKQAVCRSMCSMYFSRRLKKRSSKRELVSYLNRCARGYNLSHKHIRLALAKLGLFYGIDVLLAMFRNGIAYDVLISLFLFVR
ncbi:50S ribosomal protein L20 [Candidatus Hodgkinia cicadicola]